MKKDTEGYNYKYFDINQLLDHLLPELEKQNLTLLQPVVAREGINYLHTILIDTGADDHSQIETSIRLPDNVKPQDMGSAITYYRRYSLVSLFALRAEDDDAQKAQSAKPVKKEIDDLGI